MNAVGAMMGTVGTRQVVGAVGVVSVRCVSWSHLRPVPPEEWTLALLRHPSWTVKTSRVGSVVSRHGAIVRNDTPVANTVCDPAHHRNAPLPRPPSESCVVFSFTVSTLGPRRGRSSSWV